MQLRGPAPLTLNIFLFNSPPPSRQVLEGTVFACFMFGLCRRDALVFWASHLWDDENHPGRPHPRCGVVFQGQKYPPVCSKLSQLGCRAWC